MKQKIYLSSVLKHFKMDNNVKHVDVSLFEKKSIYCKPNWQHIWINISIYMFTVVDKMYDKNVCRSGSVIPNQFNISPTC